MHLLPSNFSLHNSLYFTAGICSEYVCSQGIVDVFEILFRRSMHMWTQRLKHLKKNYEGSNVNKSLLRHIRNQLPASSSESIRDENAKSLVLQIWQRVLKQFEGQGGAVEEEAFVRRALVNRRDEFGNTMLHLAAWNNKTDMFDRLTALGADLTAVNRNGLTPYTLSVRFGLWSMANHIWNKNFTTVYWSFGNVRAVSVEYQAFEAAALGFAAFTSSREIDACLKSLVIYRLMQGKEESPQLKGEDLEMAMQQIKLQQRGKFEDQVEISEQRAVQRPRKTIIEFQVDGVVSGWCLDTLQKCFMKEMLFNLSKFKDTELNGLVLPTRILWHKFIVQNKLLEIDSQQGNKARGLEKHAEKSALRIITIFRPNCWHEHFKDLMDEVVVDKWMAGYYLVHVGHCLIPYCFLILLFGIMWWYQRLSILEHTFWWSNVPVRAPNPPLDSAEGVCGWHSIWKSHSGAMQLVMVVYGVPSLLRLALIHSRLRPTDLDVDLNWTITTDELINFIFINMESILHVIIAGLFVTIATSRIAAG